MNLLICFIFIVSFLLVIALVRSELVFRYRGKALKVAKRLANNAIDKGDSGWYRFYQKKDSYGNYDKMFWSLHKWTYKQFYPDFN